MTGSTGESKAKLYADNTVKIVAAHNSTTITNMTSDIGIKDDKIEQLELALEQLQSKAPNLDPNISYDNDQHLPSKII